MRVQKDWTRWTNIQLFLRRVSDGDLSFQSLLFPKTLRVLVWLAQGKSCSINVNLYCFIIRILLFVGLSFIL